VQIDISNNCNKNCICCWLRSRFLKEKRISIAEEALILPLNVIYKLLKELKKIKTSQIFLSGGGEPFTHPDISQLIKIIKKMGFELFINTNFSLVTSEQLKIITDNKVDSLGSRSASGKLQTRHYPDSKQNCL